MEASHYNNTSICLCSASAISGLLHSNSGGYVYRGQAYADLIYGAYIFGDHEARLVLRYSSILNYR